MKGIYQDDIRILIAQMSGNRALTCQNRTVAVRTEEGVERCGSHCVPQFSVLECGEDL